MIIAIILFLSRTAVFAKNSDSSNLPKRYL